MKTTLPGLLVEYLVSGVVAALWLLPLAEPHVAVPISQNLLFFAPVAYVVGMLLDFAAFLVFFLPKQWIRRAVDRRRGRRGPRESGSVRQIRIQLDRPELSEEVERRSSRDRIARCTVLNLALILVVHRPLESIVSSVALVGVCAVFWVFTEWRSYSFELHAIEAIDSAKSTTAE